MDLQQGIKGKGFFEVLNLLFPNRCHFCGASLSSGACVCASCSKSIEIIEGAVCTRCGAPHPSDAKPAEKGCGQCTELTFLFGRNVSLGVFDGFLRRLIHLYKFEGRRSLYRLFAAALFIHRREYIEAADFLIPVPLSAVRYSERGFNQSYMLAKEVARLAHVRFIGSVINRSGHAAPQSSVSSQKERVSNLSDRFSVRARFEGSLKNKRLLLVDDVLTTGVTASACAGALIEAGAFSVDVLTLARSLKSAAPLYLSSNRPIMK